MKKIAVVTVARSDFGYLLPVMRKIRDHRDLELQLIVTGTHLSQTYGSTVREIEEAGLPIAERVDMLLASDAPVAVAKSIGVGVIGLAQSFERLNSDMLLLLGDRYETLAAAAAFLPFARPIAHIAGGEATEGLVDEAIRHAITKMSHLHFVSTEAYAQTVRQMGEEDWRIHVTGAPTLDGIRAMPAVADDEIARRIGLPLRPAPLLVTFHSVTLEFDRTREYIDELLAALDLLGMPVVFTYPGADARSRTIIDAVQDYVSRHSNARLVTSLGHETYYALMRRAAAMVGNSSSGIIEAASFELPVVDIGNRQRGRVAGQNVLHTAGDRNSIATAIRRATEPKFRDALRGMKNPYGSGDAAERIVAVLRQTTIDDRLIVKRFQHRESTSSAA